MKIKIDANFKDKDNKLGLGIGFAILQMYW